jgi:exodeoxyribonuclease V beta subunit
MKELDHLNVELSGRNLIEASAGTGKTYAIACLYLRLLVEQDLTPEQILVVTYTEAATEELRGRIRSRIREALGVFSGAGTDDLFLLGLQGNSNGKGPDRAKARDNLERALTSFDTASIFTIHGFCLRALQDNAFESGSLYDTELVTDQAGLLQEIVDDFWRTRFFAVPAPLLGYALHNGYSPGYFLGFLKGMLTNPMLEIIPRFSEEDITAIEQECRECLAGVRDMWRASGAEIIHILAGDKGLSRAAGNYHPDELSGLFAGMDAFVAGDNPFDLFPGFRRFASSGIAKGKKPTGIAPAHPFFDLCEQMVQKVEERFLALRWELVAYARERLPSRKRELNIRFFDDLLNDLYAALCGAAGGGFAASLREKYRAALIDEFQDTDPVQYDIFRRIYADPASPLFLIGDPKQAIYSFRGADIFAYLEAAADVEEQRRFTLTGNWRSTPRLLAAFNTVFGNGENPFVFADITYHPVKPGKIEDGKQLVCAAGDNAPLQVWHMPADEKGGPINVGKANDAIPAAIAAEISRLLQDGLNGKALIGDTPLVPGDIVVIVRSHRQAGHIQEALRNLGVPSVMRSDRSIFSTDEAREVCILLGALAEPGNEAKIRAALVTDILGRSGNDIAGLTEDEQRWEEILENFRDYHQLWLERGFMVMTQSLMAREEVRGRLLRRPDGERRLTNVLHCFEVIHQAAHDRGLGSEGLLTWFGERVSGGEAADEYQIRLETDERMVKIVTVHVSKGLEYPVVFCPFMWGGLKGNDEVVTFHDGFKMVKDFGSPAYELHRGLAQKESLAESLRLLYVALTRARFRCYLLGGKVAGRKGVNEPETSALAYLLHASGVVKESADVVDLLAKEVGALSAPQMEEQLRSLAVQGNGTISVEEMPEADDMAAYTPLRDDGTPLACREFSGIIGSDWRVASFTSFAAHGHGGAELPDRDETGRGDMAAGPTATGEKPEGMSIFTFPRGAQAGIFLHGLLEELDFASCSAEAISALVEKGLERSGYAREWGPCVTSLVNNIISTPLESPEGAFSLADLKPESWTTELEFFFPLRFVTSDTLRDYFRKWGGGYEAVDLLQLCSALSFRPVRGMVRGFIDMVFEYGGRYYLADWKSNHLGYRVEEYGRDALKREMVQRLYPLQYLLYTVALNRYLSLRVRGYDYASHFGGVLYVFLRGVSPGHGEEFGIFRDTPPVEMINDLTECLIEFGGGADGI